MIKIDWNVPDIWSRLQKRGLSESEVNRVAVRKNDGAYLVPFACNSFGYIASFDIDDLIWILLDPDM